LRVETQYIVMPKYLYGCTCRYIFGKNASSEKIPMTTPVFTQASDDKLSDVSIQIPLPMNKDLNRYIVPCVV
jgi:hypothetical protein